VKTRFISKGGSQLYPAAWKGLQKPAIAVCRQRIWKKTVA